MKIIGWNCNMAYRLKSQQIMRFKPDIAVIPECECFGEQTPKSLWFGDNPKKGLGIFSYSDYTFEVHEKYNYSFKYIIPIKIEGPIKFNLFAVWAMKGNDPSKEYIGQVWEAANYYSEILRQPTILIGDFNWDKTLDNKYKPAEGIIKVRDFLKGKDIESTYHKHHKMEFGKEAEPTEFHTKNINKPFHVDYCFASKELQIKNVEIGKYKEWIKYSDHMPVIVALD